MAFLSVTSSSSWVVHVLVKCHCQYSTSIIKILVLQPYYFYHRCQLHATQYYMHLWYNIQYTDTYRYIQDCIYADIPPTFSKNLEDIGDVFPFQSTLKFEEKKSFHPTAHLYHRELPAVVFLGPMFMFSCHKPSRWAVGQAGGKSLALNEGCGCFKDGLLSYHQLGWHLYFLETHWFPIEEASNNSNTPKGKNDKNGVKSINFNPHPTWNPSNPAVGTSLLLGRSPCQHDF